MQSLESLGKSLSISKNKLEETMPGAFVEYIPVKQKSSEIELASSVGVLRKKKKRKFEKTIFEFLSLEVWNNLLNSYSDVNDMKFRAPKPMGLYNHNLYKSEILMEFINGYELKKFNRMKRTTPVKIRGQNYPIPLYPACALHLGALDEIKEKEGIIHGDYDLRHIIFSPIENVSIGIVDVENSRGDSLIIVEEESKKLFERFQKITSSPRDLKVLESWYEQGRESLNLPQGTLQLDRVLEEIKSKFDVDLDFSNYKINNYCIRASDSFIKE